MQDEVAAEGLEATPLAAGKIETLMQETGVEDLAPHMAEGPMTTPTPIGGAGSVHCQGQAGTTLESIKIRPQVLFSFDLPLLINSCANLFSPSLELQLLFPLRIVS